MCDWRMRCDSVHITSVAFPESYAREMLKKLDRSGIACGLGSACTGCSTKVSHVLDAAGIPTRLAEATLRFSLGWSTTAADAEEMGILLSNRPCMPVLGIS